MDDRRDLPDDEPGPPLVYISHDAGMPTDAQRLGLDRNTEEGALISLAGSLNPAKALHRAVAWGLIAAFSLPLLVTIWRELF